nr:murein biosynthesis integral membrane protein MurJ [Microlunatus panaciterrae]
MGAPDPDINPDPDVTVLDERPSTSSKLISATALMAAGTMLSRVIGFGRVALIAAVLGNGTRQAEMFTLANTVPNSIYILLAGGALNTVLVPQIVRAVKHDKDGGEAYTNRIMTAFLAIVAVITAVATALAPLIIGLYSSASWRSPAIAAQYESMVTLGYLCLPQIFFYGAFFLAGQVLNARERFGPMMFAPAANNVVSIGVFVLYLVVWGSGNDTDGAFSTQQELVLGLGATAGIAVQAAILVPFMRAAGFHYRPRFDLKGTGLGHTFRLARWTLGFVVITQVALVVVSKLASSATSGGDGAGVTVYNNAYLLWILPHSLITVSLATAMLPNASRLAAAGDLVGVRVEATRTMRLAVTALVPATVAFLTLGQPIARLLFGFGAGARDAPYIGWALMAFAIGLVPFTLQYICLRVFYALEDTRSTFFLQLAISLVNITLALAIVLPLGAPRLVATGLGLAYSGAYAFGLVLSLRKLGGKLPGLQMRELARHCLRLLAAVLPGGLVAALVCWGVSFWSTSQLARAVALVLGGLVAVGLFLLLARLLHIDEVTEIVRAVLRRGPTTDNAVDGGGSEGAELTSSHTIKAGISPDDVSSSAGARSTTTDAGPGMSDGPQDAPASTSEAGTDNTGSATSPTELPTPAMGHHPIPAGTVLGERYRLEELLADTGQTATWRAFDQVLSRSVLIHLLSPDDEREAELLAVARRAAAATDSRFLRVLDAVHSTGTAHGSYIVCEYANGQSLEIVLASGPLSGLEAAWLVREVADALSGVHVQGLYHERISPDTVIITPAGNVKIVGLLIEAALRPNTAGEVPDADSPKNPDVPQNTDGPQNTDRPQHTDRREKTDVLDLGRLLYACLVCRWPGGQNFGLAAAPPAGHRWLTPRQVRAGVSPALDSVCDQILGDPPRHRAPQLETANDIVNALTKVLGAADASSDLERRLRQPIPMVGGTDATVIRQPVGIGDLPTEQLAAVDLPDARRAPSAPQPAAGSGAAATRALPVNPPPPPPPPPARRRRWIAVLIALVALLALTAVIVGLTVFRSPGRGSSGKPTPSASAPAKPTKLKIASASDFDPQQTGSGPKSENPDEVPNAYDGDPQTRWRTLSYRGDPRFGRLKDGLGLVLDLGEAAKVSSVKLLLSGNGTDLEIRVPQSDPATTMNAPMTSADDWRTVSGQKDVGKSTTLSFDQPVTTRFVLIYLTSLPKEGDGYRGGIYEVEVFG